MALYVRYDFSTGDMAKDAYGQPITTTTPKGGEHWQEVTDDFGRGQVLGVRETYIVRDDERYYRRIKGV